MPQFYKEHFYLWGYAFTSIIFFIGAVLGLICLLRSHRSFGTALLGTGSVLLALFFMSERVGWLILSKGDAALSSTEQPQWDILKSLTLANHLLIIAGASMVVFSVYFVARDIKALQLANRQNQKSNKSEHITPDLP